ncbi:MAG: hypothetical protein GY811_03695 [Myxococcales bacterium]|nr:hypothetical protein [Myxococcales bacterium]
MRNWLIGTAAMGLLVAVTPASQVQASPLSGTVVSSESRWGYGHSLIVTESVVEQSDGSRITVHQVGGTHEGIGMRQSHSLPLLAIGDSLVAEAQARPSSTGRTFHLLREVHSLRRASLAEKNQDTQDFVRTETAAGYQVYWASGCALLSVASEGSEQIAGDTEFQVVDQVLEAWQDEAGGCSDFSLVNEGTTDTGVGFDGINVIKFREDLWCRPATKDDPQQCYEEAAAGITTLFFIKDGSERVGEILDADIELNGVQFAFAVNGQTSGTAQCDADLANTLTHEVGHFLGLDHTCWIGQGQRLGDEQGNQVPSCSLPTLSESITEATMYNFQSCGETKKATVEADDVAGMCAIYPSGEHPTTCEPADVDLGGCCSVAGNRSPGASGSPALFGLGLLGLMLAFRRQRAENNS